MVMLSGVANPSLFPRLAVVLSFHWLVRCSVLPPGPAVVFEVVSRGTVKPSCSEKVAAQSLSPQVCKVPLFPSKRSPAPPGIPLRSTEDPPSVGDDDAIQPQDEGGDAADDEPVLLTGLPGKASGKCLCR